MSVATDDADALEVAQRVSLAVVPAAVGNYPHMTKRTLETLV